MLTQNQINDSGVPEGLLMISSNLVEQLSKMIDEMAHDPVVHLIHYMQSSKDTPVLHLRYFKGTLMNTIMQKGDDHLRIIR